MFELITSAKESDDWSIGFISDCGRKQQEVTKNKKKSGKYHFRIMPEDTFGFAEHQEECTDGMA